MGKYYLGTGTSQINFQVVDSTGVINDLNLSGLYLSVTGKAADADKLDGFDSSYYLNASNLTGSFTGTLSGTIDNANLLDNLDSTYFLNAKNLTGYISGNVTTNYLSFASGLNLNPIPGQVTWADNPGTMQVGLVGGNVDLNVGFQSYEFVTNRTPSTLSKGTVVYVSGAQGNRPAVSPAIGTADSTSAATFGITAESIASMADGYVITQGILTNLNTTGFAEGAALYLSPTVSGAITSTKPQAPQHSVLVGFCVRSHASVGEILVKIQNGLEFDELHDVRISGVQNNDIVRYNSTSGVWYNSNTLALDGTGVHYVSGSLGVGTSSPTEKLEVVGNALIKSSSGDSSLRVRGNGAYLQLESTIGGYSSIFGLDGSTLKWAIGQFGFGGANGLAFYYGSSLTEAMRVNAAGNIGINSTSPSTKLQINAANGGYNLFFDQGNSTPGGSNPWLGLFNNTSISAATYGWGFYDSTTDGSLQLWGKNNSTTAYHILTVLRGGNVGIGTASPSYKLHVDSGTDEYQIAWKRSSSKLWALGSDSAGAYITNITDSVLPIYIKNGGSIGVGTTNPLNKFVISNSGNTGIEFNAGLTFGPFTDVGYIACYNRAAAAFKDLVIEAGGSQYVVFKSNGSVGIGTGNPYEKLEVNGAIAATGAGTGTAAQSSAVIISWESTYGAVTSVDWGAEFKPIAIRAKTIDFQIGTGSTSSKVYIDGNGNLGVGTTTPLYNLEVAKTSAGANLFVNADMGAAGEASIIGFTSSQYHTYYKAAIIAYDPYGGSWNRRGLAFCVNGTADGTNASYANDKALYIAPDKTSTFYESVTVSKASPELSIRSVSDAAGQIQYLTFGSPTYNRAQFRSTSAGTSDGSLALYTFNAGSPTLAETWAKDGSVTLSNANDITVGTYATGALQVAGGVSISKGLQVGSSLSVAGSTTGSKSITVTNSYTTGLTISLNSHAGVFVRVTIHGDLTNNSAIGYMGEFFVQNGGGAFSEPGMIIREVNNTNNGSAVFSCNIVDPAGTTGARNFELQFKQNSATASVSATIIYTVQGTFNSIS